MTGALFYAIPILTDRHGHLPVSPMIPPKSSGDEPGQQLPPSCWPGFSAKIFKKFKKREK